MPPKDDDEPKTTKEVVTKKHKQMLNREELDLSLVAEAFGGLLMEAPKKKSSGGEFKEPEPPKNVRIDPKIDPQQADIDDFKREQGSAQSGGRSKGSQPKVVTPQPGKYEFDPKTGAPTRKSVVNYATEVETLGTAGGRRTPKEVKLTPEDIAKRTRSVRDTFASADKGDLKAQQQVQKWTDALTKKHGSKPTGVEEPRGGQRIRSRSTGRTRRTRTSADPGLRDLQGRKGQAPLDPELQKAASRRAGQVPDEPTVGGESKPSKGASRRARARGQAQAQGAGRPGRGSTGRSGGQILRDLIGKEADIERIKSDIEKRDAQTAANRKRGAAKAKQTLQRKATSAAIRAQDTARVRSTPKPGGPLGGYKPTPTSTPANVARQMKVDPRAITRTRALTTPSAQPRGASGGDAGAAVRQAMKQRAAAAKPPAVTKPAVPSRQQRYDAARQELASKNLKRLGGLGSRLFGLTRTAAGRGTIGALTATPMALEFGKELGRVSRQMEVDKKSIEALKPIKKGTTISWMNPRTGNVEQLTQAEFEAKRSSKTGTAVKPETKPEVQPAKPTPPVEVDTKGEEPKEAPKPKPIPKTIPGVKIGPGGFQITPTKPTRRGDKKGRFRLPGLGFPQQPGGKIGRRANPQ